MKISDFRLVVFESNLRKNYYPLSLTKPVFDLMIGTGSVLEAIEKRASSTVSDLFVPSYLEKMTVKNRSERKVNKFVPSKCVLINSQISYDGAVWNLIEESISNNPNTVFVDSEMNLVFGILDEASPDLLSKKIPQTKKIGKKALPPELESSALMKYPWDLLHENGDAIVSAFSESTNSKDTLSNFETLGEKVRISPSADIERYVTFDSRSGPIIVEDQAEVQSYSHITGPTFIGKGSKIRSARIRGNTSIGRSCRVAGEVEESIISDFSNKSHDGFIGHSYIGSWVNIGALTTNSDLKNTYGNIKVTVGKTKVDTGMPKVGIFMGDMAKTAIGTMITSGCKVGVASQVFGVVTKDVPSFTIFGESLGTENVELYIKSAIETQSRMMRRRGTEISEEYIAMMKYAFSETKAERALNRVKKGKFAL